MSDKTVSSDSWRLQLVNQARAVAAQAESEGRTLFTYEEEVRLDSLMKEYNAALMVEKLIRNEGKE